MKYGMIVGIFAVLGAIALPASATTLPVRGSADVKIDAAAEVQVQPIEGTVFVDKEATIETGTAIPETQTIEVTTSEETVSPETPSESESLEAIRRNNIKQKLEALYGETTIETETVAKVEVQKKETGIKGFFKTIIKLFE